MSKHNIIFVCPFCGKRYKLFYGLIHHVRFTHGYHDIDVFYDPDSRKWVCPICNKKFRSRVAFTDHLILHRDDPKHFVVYYAIFRIHTYKPSRKVLEALKHEDLCRTRR